MSLPDSSPIQQLAETARDFYRRGWVTGSSGNFSVLLARKPLRLFITPAGNDSGTFDSTNFLEIDGDAEILQGFGRPSDETLLHLSIFRQRPKARCILYSHSVWGVLLADRLYTEGGIKLTGYEVLKGIADVETYEHTEMIPIIENSNDHVAQSHVIENILVDTGNIHGIFIRKHGLFTWGESVTEARRHVEIFEHLFEILARQQQD